MENTASKSVFIFGCGYVGSRLANKLLSLGYKVGALTKNKATAEALLAEGVSEVIVSDLESHEWHAQIGLGYNYVVNCVSSSGGGIEGYNRSYIQGQSSILEWAKSQQIDRYIYTSSTSVYAGDQGCAVDENSALVDESSSPTGSIILQSERLVEQARECFDRYHILRLSGIYGPGRHYLLNQLTSESVIAGEGELYMNMIYVEDAVLVISSIINSDPHIVSGTYNLSDDSPTLKLEVAEWICRQINSECPEFDRTLQSGRNLSRKSRTKNRKISNKKLRQFFDLKYPTFMQGYKAILEDIKD